MSLSMLAIMDAESEETNRVAALQRFAERVGWRVEQRVGAAVYAVYARDNTLLISGPLDEVHYFLKGARVLAALYESSMMTYHIAHDGLEHINPPGWYVRGCERVGPRETATLASMAAYEALSERKRSGGKQR